MGLVAQAADPVLGHTSNHRLKLSRSPRLAPLPTPHTLPPRFTPHYHFHRLATPVSIPFSFTVPLVDFFFLRCIYACPIFVVVFCLDIGFPSLSLRISLAYRIVLLRCFIWIPNTFGIKIQRQGRIRRCFTVSIATWAA